MCASTVETPPEVLTPKTTFSPVCATGRGANGFGGGPLQNNPPQAPAGAGARTNASRPVTIEAPAAPHLEAVLLMGSSRCRSVTREGGRALPDRAHRGGCGT